jgi:hypothetical protein
VLTALVPVAPAFATVVTIISDHNYNYADIPFSDANLDTSPNFVGTGTAAAPGGLRFNGYMVFELPDLNSQTLLGASFSFSAFYNSNTATNSNADLWGIGFTTGVTQILENYSADDPNGDPGNVRI